VREQKDVHIKALIPIGIEGLLYYARCVCLFCINGDNGEWVGKTEDIALGQAISSDD
jgi:hypothetical protein